MHVESALLFESPEEIFERVFRHLLPKAEPPEIRSEFCKFANANSFIRMENGAIHVRMADIFADAPAPVLEALAYILVSKLYRRRVPAAYSGRYRLYLNRKDIRLKLQAIKRQRGRKLLAGVQGSCYNLEQIFRELNEIYFKGLLAMPVLGWSRSPSKSILGHYDPSHHTIVLSAILDRPEVPKVAVDYVMFHEMLHLRYPVQHRGTRRCVHTPEFKEAEKQFSQLAEARELLKRLG